MRAIFLTILLGCYVVWNLFTNRSRHEEWDESRFADLRGIIFASQRRVVFPSIHNLRYCLSMGRR